MGLQNKSTKLKEVCCALIAYIPVLFGGMQAGFPAYIAPQLRKEISLTIDQMSWIASIGFVSSIFGPLLSMFLTERFGRRRNLQLILLLSTIGWIIIFISKHFNNLIVGLTLCGIAAGTAFPVAALYVTEISRARSRSSLLSFIWLMSIIGTSLVHTLEFYLSWRYAVIAIIIFSFLGFYLLTCIPESKYWYIIMDKKEEAKYSALWFENTQIVKKEVDIIYAFTKLGKNFTDDTNTCSVTWTAIKNLPIKLFLLTVIISILRCGTGKVLFMVYPVSMFNLMRTPYNSVLLGVWFGFINFLCCMGNMAIFGAIDKYNRKNFFYILTILMVIILSINICAETLSDAFIKPLSGLRTFCLFMYLVIEGTGYFCITSIMINELIPIMQRGIGLTLTYMISNLFLAAYIKFFPFLEPHITFRDLCIYFLTNIVLIAVIVCKYLPDTRSNLFFGTFTNTYNMTNSDFNDGEFDKMMNEDWFRNEQVQQYFTENELFNLNSVNTLSSKFNKQILDKVRQGVKLNKNLMIPQQQSALMVGEQLTLPLPTPEQIQKNTELWFDNMKKWNPWMNKDFFENSSNMFKQQQQWFGKIWSPPQGHVQKPQRIRKKQFKEKKQTSPDGAEKIV